MGDLDLIFDICDLDFISFVEKNYKCKFKNFLYFGLDYRFINDIYVLSYFHEVYLKLGDRLSDELSDKLRGISDKYMFLISKRIKYINDSNINENNISIKHNPRDVTFDEISYIKEYSGYFSLDYLFSLEEVSKFEDKRLSGVCLITPIQTVCMVNEFRNGHVGSGYHNDSFSRIIKVVYGESFVDDVGISYVDSWQDIMVSISNNVISTDVGMIQRLDMVVHVPVPISESQKRSLEILNDEIKKYQLDNNVLIEVSSSLVNDYNDEFFIEFEGRSNFDDILNWVIVKKNYDFEYKDKNIVGFLNGENYFNVKSDFIKK